jgi:hypothetical protein
MSCAVVFIVFNYKGPIGQREAALPDTLPNTLPNILQSPLQKLLSGTLLPLAPDPVALGVMQASGQEDVRAEDMAPLLDGDATYRSYLFAQTFLAERMSEWLSENEGAPERNRILLDRLLRLLGKTPVRNLVACARIGRVVEAAEKAGAVQGAKTADGASKGPALGPGKDEGKISVTPSRVIPCALAAENLCQEKGWVNPQGAFAAGLHYDGLAALLKARAAPPDEKSALDAAFKEGTLIGKMAYELGQRVGKVQHGRYLFAAGLLLPVGKALMGSLYPASLDAKSWAKFVKACDQAGERAPELLLFGERRRFAVTHAELSSLVANFGALLRPIEKAIYFYPEPYLLKRADADLYQLSSVLSVAARMARFKEQRPPLEAFHESWLKANGIDAGTLKLAASAALK